MNVLEAIKKDADLELTAQIDVDRILVKVPIDRLHAHESFLAIRASDPPEEIFKVLEQSVKERGQFYPPLIFAEANGNGLNLYIADGHQRVRASRKAGVTHLVVCIILNWHSIDQAFRDATSAQFAKYAVSEADVFSIAATKKLTVAELAILTGYSETKLRRIVDIADMPILSSIVQKKYVGTTQMHRLLKKCSNNQQKVDALSNSLATKLQYAETEAEKWKNKNKDCHGGKIDKTAKEKADPKFYFKTENWGQWLHSLGDENTDAKIKIEADKIFLDLESEVPSGKYIARIGDVDEWASTFSIHNLANFKHDEVDLESLGEIVKNLPLLCDRIETIYKRRCDELGQQKALEINPMPTNNATLPEDKPAAKPMEQVTDGMIIE